MVRVKCYTYIIVLFLAVSYFKYNSFLDHQRHLKHQAFIQLATLEKQKYGNDNYPFEEQLTEFFGPLNAQLIRNHYQEFYNINTDSNAYDFYKNTLTLKGALGNALKKKLITVTDSTLSNLNFNWFTDAAPSLKITKTNSSYKVDIDYSLLKINATKSKGANDDQFFVLYEESYENYYFPVWLAKNAEKNIYSRLGTGIHFSLLSKVENEIKNGTHFEKEILKIKRLIITDLLFSKNFATSKEKVTKELTEIYNSHSFKEKEKEMLTSKIEKLRGQSDKFSFNLDTDNLLSEAR